MKRTLFFLCILLLWGPASWAGQVTLVNGDRITGEIVRLQDEKLVIRSEFAGEVRLQWTAILQLQSDAPLHLVLNDGRALVGMTEGGESEWRVLTPAGPVTLTRGDIAVLRSESEQQQAEAQQQKARRAGIFDRWFGQVDLGLSAARGNADTTTLNVGTKAERATDRDRVQLYFASLYARNRSDGTTVTAANAVRGGVQYDRNVTQRTFVFGFADYAADELQDLDLRSVYGGGLGWQIFQSPRISLEAFGGGSYNRESFSTGLDRNSAEVLGGQDFAWKVAPTISLVERLVFYPNLTQPGEYRIHLDSSLTGKLNRWLGWNLTVSDRFISNPLPGTRRNDILITSGLQITFGQEAEFRTATRRGAVR